MAKNETKSPVISQGTTTAEGLKVNTVLLADNLLPSKFEDSKFVPRQANELLKEYAKYSLERKAGEKPKEMIAALGSTETIYSPTDCGLFAAVLTAYNNHWKLRTSPDDWWFCVIKRVASAIDKNAKKESVRKMFVDHEEKKTIEVEVPDSTIYTVDYSWFFDQIAKGIQENVKVPEFVDGMTADFSTTTAVQKIVSQITLMYSVQEYFNYMMMTMCGIPAVEMLGTEDDWSKLKSKLKVLRTLLEPIENDLGLPSEWWDLVEKVFRELLDTYQGKPDREWWSHIMSYKKAFMSGESGGFRGWMTEFLEGTKRAIETCDMTTGLVSVPLVIKDPSGVQDTATLVAGMLGFTIHTDDTKEVSVQPFQGWSLVLSKDSPFVI
ncbi:hypothetical protein OS493_007281 [Desmophyllum pertusum]|uniref:Uncharacterized protein n=1 Tax=Desmophyllum pertusum TaxID=174260 RepID=A0A9W9Z2L9_9CNID|nr:hypothetical protein OS493_007281 [Desmophyllum pertusum]